MSASPPSDRDNFIYDIIDEDLANGTHDGRVATRFPPEPNGYLHIGHAKSICLNFGIKHDYADRARTQCHLRFDDTNPETESMEYVASIKEAVRWLGYDWGEHLYFASDYFEQFYAYACTLIAQGDAYVDSLSEEEIREYRGTVNEPGRPSPYRDRSVEENMELFRRMRAGDFPDGAHVLRAKIDMASPHMIMRDPLLYRIKHAHHYRNGDDWCIYPMYDFAHPLEDAIEGITHSLCTLEFDNNRRVYDWVLEHCLPAEEVPQRPHQYEFARLNVDYTIMSKRKLLHLVETGAVDGWDDPRLPTLAGLRRRGVPPSAIRAFCHDVGVTRSESRVEISLLEHAIRDDLNTRAPRVMAVLDPLKVVVTNVDEDTVDWLEVPHWPREIDNDETRAVPFTRELYIERDDFRMDPPDDFYRLAPGREVRLRGGYFLTCTEAITDDDGAVVELRATIDPATRDSTAPDGRSPRGTIHWVSGTHGVPIEARLIDRLFTVPAPDAQDAPFTEFLNPEARVVQAGIVEPSVRDLPADTRLQFERQGYFWQDPVDSAPDALVFNRIVPLRDPWAAREEAARKEALEAKRKAKEAEKAKQRKRSMEAQRDPVERLTEAQRQRFAHYHFTRGVAREDAAVLAADDAVADFYEAALDAYDAPQALAHWVVNDLMRVLKDRSLAELPFGPEELAALVRLAADDVVNSRGAREVFDVLVDAGGDPEAIVDARGLRQINDRSALQEAVTAVIDAHPDEAARYRAGETKLLGFFMGQVMRETQGAANPEEARALLRDRLQE
ncbi:glutamine--tRNA ligase/YqeY domain fusion protein [Salisaeta longa]|uniref:glutamine--tRNA ligase/YqeY domain fusion protein n=1 Tax=Salisaeta longa TaxID=503170 RepID=UPI0003B6BAA4|nr:glutamine--tRNA ligase/YqeY domain fusion protein [Salisaeta longa]